MDTLIGIFVFVMAGYAVGIVALVLVLWRFSNAANDEIPKGIIEKFVGERYWIIPKRSRKNRRLSGNIYKRLPESLSRAINDYYPNGGQIRIAPTKSGHNPNYRKDRNKQICHDRTQGISQKEIAEKYGLCLITIKRILKENGMTTKKERLNIIDDVKIFLKQGYSKKAIAKKLDISRTTLYAHMKRGGIQ